MSDMEKVSVTLVFMDGRKRNAKVKWDDLPDLKKGTIIRTTAEPIGYYQEGVLESWDFPKDVIIVDW